MKLSIPNKKSRQEETPTIDVSKNYNGWKVYKKEDTEIIKKDVGLDILECSIGTDFQKELSKGDTHVYFESGKPIIGIKTVYGEMLCQPIHLERVFRYTQRYGYEYPDRFCNDREEQIAYDYVKHNDSIYTGYDYIQDMEDIRRIMSPDATWKDAFMMPKKRRTFYEDGYDTLKRKYNYSENWSKTIEERINTLLNTVTKEQRQAEGYYLAEEVNHEKDKSRIKFINGELYIKKRLRLNNLQKISGNIVLEEESAFCANNLKSIDGNLTIDDATFQTDKLQEIIGYIYCHNYQEKEIYVTLNNLQYIDEDIHIKGNVILKSDNLQTVRGRIHVVNFDGMYGRDKATLQADNLSTVKNSISLGRESTLIANKLITVEGDLVKSYRTKLNIEQLKTIKGDFVIKSWTKADNLQTIGGCLDMRDETTLIANNLQTIKGKLYMERGATLQADSLTTIKGKLEINKKAILKTKNLKNNPNKKITTKGITR